MKRIVIRILTVLLTVYGAMFYCKTNKNSHAGHDHGAHQHAHETQEADDHASHEAHEHKTGEGHDDADHDEGGKTGGTHDHETHSHAQQVTADEHGHNGHDHDADEKNVHEVHPDNEQGDHDHGVHDHDEHGHGGTGVRMDADAQRIAGIRIDTLRKRRFSRTLELPGRVGFNEDRLVHVSPRFGGVVKAVKTAIGSFVRKGEVLAVMENNATLSMYEVTAPFAGTIIEKHATLGESVGEDRELFVLADLSQVWVNCDVYASDIDILEKGLPVKVTTIDGKTTAEAVVHYIAPVFREGSSTGYLRIVLSNSKRKWRPGMFIRVLIIISDIGEVPVVNSEAVQIVDEEQVLFIPGSANSFFTRPIAIGRRTAELAEVTGGIGEGEPYVAEGAFELKATLITSGMDPHAGHGH